MGVTRRHGLYGVLLPGSVTLGGVRGQTIEAESNVVNDTSSGDIYPTHLAMNSQMIRARWSSTSVALGINNVPPLTGLAATSSNKITFYAYKHAEGGGRAASTNHRKYEVNEGITVVRRISCGHQEDAIIEFETFCTYDGTNVPVVITDSVAVPTQGTDAARFTIGKCTINSDLIDHIRSWELDFGLLVEPDSSDSDKWPTFVSVLEAKPIFRLRGIDIEWFKSTVFPLEGSVAAHAATTIYLRKRSPSTASGFVADGTEEHISFTMEGLAHLETLFDATSQGNPPAEVSLVMPLRFDGTNAPVVIDTTAAIA